jgi:hypothetical protein
MSGETLFLVYHDIQMKDDLIQQIRDVKRTALQRSPIDLDPANPSYRLQVFGWDESGCRLILDVATDEQAAV